MYEPTPEQIKGHEDHVKARDKLCEGIKAKYNAISPKRQKAIDFVKEKAAKDKQLKDFLNNKPNEKTTIT